MEAPDSIVATWMQEADSCDPDQFQTLVVETQDAGCGPFVVIRTERWALSDDDGSIDALVERVRWVLGQARNETEGGEKE